ncbi:tail protein X [Sporosarcina sp. FSL K6-1508]|uniref:tail protein X n=1 Tax=Sporosarcina sp. FSL K6-1508 TaxID=2921553 RepID=UPI0030F94130
MTVQGDMWDTISKNIYGSEYHTDLLMKANPDLASELLFSSGVELIVPELEETQQFSNLPPWKRGTP